MIKPILLSLIIIVCLIINKNLFPNQKGKFGYWIFSILALIIFIIELHNINIPIPDYLASFVKPIRSWIWGGLS
ncbi:hypothetical protein GCM10007380_40350 [Gottfriedia solisilvae]|uniref:Uncharacterized protein n=1 Tax=Gottfriedia solisilvae TaxID=1516104 RepID=A0A8J3AWK0_9BACI|nr:hypothetical protein GCM10007380_40350 [Gottfriedia solisilvae]